jgi:iron-sulfur cluster assembly protein
MKKTLNLTDAAIARVTKLMEEKGVYGVRIGVTTKGCSGFVHTLDYAKEEHPSDLRLEQKGAVIFIDPAAVPIVQGSVMDWVEQELEQRFIFHNPNAKGTCGCGESFTV